MLLRATAEMLGNHRQPVNYLNVLLELPWKRLSDKVAGMSTPHTVHKLLCYLALALMFSGCEAIEQEERNRANARIDRAIDLHKAAAMHIKLGDSKDKVLALLEPTQFGLLSDEIKAPTAFPTERENGTPRMVEVFYFRSYRYADEHPRDSMGNAPSDDFTPYVFTDDILTGIGWTNLLSLNLIKPPSQHHPQEACKELGPLAGCF